MSMWLSKLAPHLQQFEETKKALGYTYRRQSESLHSFDKFCFENFPEATTITKEITFAWLKNKKSNEKSSTTNKKLSLLIELSKFIKLTDSECFIPDKRFRLKEQQFICRIITDEEINKLLHTIHRIENTAKSPYKVQTCKTYFTLLYCTGLRSSEAINLNRAHINFDTGEIQIVESKCHSNRKIVLSNKLLILLKQYDSYLSPTREPFFSLNGVTRPSIGTLADCLKKAWKLSGLTSTCVRQHDFRHTFITKRILEWQKNHMNLSEKIQNLMNFVGHRHIDDTLYYFRLVPELSCYFNLTDFDEIIPNFGDNDENRIY